MHTIWKFHVPSSDTFTLELPARARFLDVQVQQGTPVLWFLVDPDADKVMRRFVLCGTGKPVPEAELLTHLGTFQLYLNQLVVHLFEYDALAPVR